MSHSQFHSINCLYLDMHGLIFETSVWLLAGSTRLLVHELRVCNNYFQQEIDAHSYWVVPSHSTKSPLYMQQILPTIVFYIPYH